MNPILAWVLIGIGFITETGVWLWIGGLGFTILAVIFGGLTGIWWAGPFILQAQDSVNGDKPE